MLPSSSLKQVADLLISRQQRLFVVEASCGGSVQAALSAQPGASAWLLGGLNCYHDSIKTGVLRMPQELLDGFGAVSEITVQALIQHGLALSRADWVLAESGVYGPAGGSPEKPVGLVYTAVGCAGSLQIEQHRFSGDRASLREQAALALVRQLIAAVEAQI